MQINTNILINKINKSNVIILKNIYLCIYLLLYAKEGYVVTNILRGGRAL